MGSIKVTESSIDRDRFSGANFLSAYDRWNKLPTINAVTLAWLDKEIINRPDAIVAAIKPNTELAIAISRLTIKFKAPETSIAPVSKIAEKTMTNVLTIE